MIPLPDTTIQELSTNDRIGRIAVGGTHKGVRVAVVIEPDEVPPKVKTPKDMETYLLARIRQAAEEKA